MDIFILIFEGIIATGVVLLYLKNRSIDKAVEKYHRAVESYSDIIDMDRVRSYAKLTEDEADKRVEAIAKEFNKKVEEKSQKTPLFILAFSALLLLPKSEADELISQYSPDEYQSLLKEHLNKFHSKVRVDALRKVANHFSTK